MCMKPAPDARIGDLAADWPVLIAYFEKKRLDFCCSGQRSLKQACLDLGLDPELVVGECRELIQSPAGEESEKCWNKAAPAELINHILERYHEGHRMAIDVIRPLMEKVAGHHGERYPELLNLSQLVTWLFNDVQPHMMKEEQVLFPIALEMIAGNTSSGPCGHIGHPIAAMEEEHQHAGNLLNEIRELTHGFQPPNDACRSFRALYANLEEFDGELRRHIHLENNVLFPKLQQL